MDNASVIHSAPLSPLQRQSIICIQSTTIQSVQPTNYDQVSKFNFQTPYQPNIVS